MCIRDRYKPVSIQGREYYHPGDLGFEKELKARKAARDALGEAPRTDTKLDK